MSTTNIYVLRLESGNYYIGKSNDVYSRYQTHLNGDGSAWTRKYKPISLVKTVENVSPFEEDKVTKEYMSKYGIDKVRGGSYVELELNDFQKETLNREIWAAKDLCTNCGRSGHFVKDCRAKTEYNELLKAGANCSRVSNRNPKIQTKKGVCYRCGRPGHYSPDCYARTKYNGYTLNSNYESDDDSDYESDDDSD